MKRKISAIITDFDNENEIRILIAKNIGEKIKKIRVQHKISGLNLAKVIGISQQQLSRYENGLGDISVCKLFLISFYFKIDISFFLESNV